MNVILWHCFWWPDARSPFATLDASWSESARTIAETETKTEKNGRVQTKWNYANFCGVGELASLRHLHRKKSINFIKSKTHLIFSISRAHYSGYRLLRVRVRERGLRRLYPLMALLIFITISFVFVLFCVIMPHSTKHYCSQRRSLPLRRTWIQFHAIWMLWSD